jgi:hypothetical protein
LKVDQLGITGELSKNFHGVGIGPLSNILAVKSRFNCTGKEDHLRSPYLDEEFVKAREKGIIPDTDRTVDIGGSWSAIRGETGEATNLNLAHVQG